MTARIYAGPLAAGAPVQTLAGIARRQTVVGAHGAARARPVHRAGHAGQRPGINGVSAPTTFTVVAAAPVASQPGGGSSQQQTPGDRTATGSPTTRTRRTARCRRSPARRSTPAWSPATSSSSTRPARGRGRSTPPKGFVPLKGAANVPMGSQLDTRQRPRRGDVGGRHRRGQDADGGLLRRALPGQAGPAQEEAQEAGGADHGPRPQGRAVAVAVRAAEGRARPRRRPSKKKRGAKSVLGSLWGNGKGKFRTNGKYSSATVRGTIWLTQDRCDGTLTTVKRGTVSVRDFKLQEDGVREGRAQLPGARAARASKANGGRSEAARVSMATDARIGAELAGYRIEAPIGRGGMGIVYRAEQLRLGRKVALKLLAPELAENRGLPRALRARVAPRGRARPPEHRPALRGRRGRRAAVHQHALRRGHRPARAAQRAGPARARARAARSPARSPARSTPRTCAASSTATSSRANILIAARRRPRPARALLPHRLRPDQGHVVAGRAHGDGHLRRDHRLHRPRADRGRQARRARRPVRARLRALRVPRPGTRPSRATRRSS